MSKLTAVKPKEFYLSNQEITINYTPIPGFKLQGLLKGLNKITDEDQKNDKMLNVFLTLIKEHTDLDNTEDEIKDILSLDEIMELGGQITGTEKTTKNFTKPQS